MVVFRVGPIVGRRRWEWRVDEQVVSAELINWMGRATIAVDGVRLARKYVWGFATKIPLKLPGAGDAVVIVSTRWNLTTRLTLEVEGQAVEPRVVPRMSTVQRVFVGIFGLAYATVAILAVAPWILGGSDIPPPKWNEQDLAPMPREQDNAWYAMLDGADVPDWGDRCLLDDHERIPPSDLQTAEEELARLDVAALLAKVPDVLSRPVLAFPPEDGSARVLQLRDWRYWLALSLSRRIEREPGLAAEVLVRTLPMWVDCANRARNVVVYFVCAMHAERDLILLAQTLEYMGSTRQENRDAMRTAVADSGLLSAENVTRASYIEAYELLRTSTSDTHLFVDKRDTLAAFDQMVERASPDADCEKPVEFELWRALYRYNHGGMLFAENNARSYCIDVERITDVTQSVSDARTHLLKKLKAVDADQAQ
jgi:hypothetical protein